MTLIEQFQQLFRGRENVHGQMWYEDGQKKVNTVRNPATEAQWQAHIDGSGRFLGQVPIRQDNQCYFAAIDVDDKDVDHAELEQRCVQAKIPATICRSKSGGAHLYFFFLEPVPADIVARVLTQYITVLKLANPDGRGVEIFPKQKKMKPEQLGNWINLPYWGGDATNRWAMVDGQQLTFAEFIGVAMSRRLTQAGFEATVLGDDVFAEGPPCLRTLHKQGIVAGYRNQALYNIAVYHRLRFGQDAFAQHVRDYNDEFLDPPLDKAEVDTLIASVGKDDAEYKYKCQEPPINAVCKQRTCLKQRFGIKHWATEERRKTIEERMPTFGQLIHIKSDPAKFILIIDGKRLQFNTEELDEFRIFRRRCMDQGKRLPRLKVDEWDAIVDELWETMLSLPAPKDASPLGQFASILGDFLDQAEAVAEDVQLERVLVGSPATLNGRTHFRPQDLDLFTKKRGFKAYYAMKDVYAALHELYDGDIEEGEVAGQAVWSVPYSGGRPQLAVREGDAPRF